MLGITFNPTTDLKNWADEFGLESKLLCDADRSVALAYGAAESADQERATRLSVLVGPDGVVAKTYESFDAEAHATDALGDIS